MKFLYFTLVLAALFMLISQAEAGPCKATSCSCSGIPNGLFCGDGNLGCTKGHVYQCGSDGKNSCDFGIRNSCVKCNKLKCP
ncbi:hypothetical protein BCR42DRAFT_420108 [Absidia repens]|uniref:Uncharacterized protein n=1 Tax=Absidia repens TaxID=90262 RepID=A0A1X2IAR0_9FUNG|nr:hypothetical protein BCR42DRAFT_420108 [Absidia repens]